MKKILTAIWTELVYGGHLLSFGAVSIVYTASILLDIRVTWDFLLVVYLGTESVYLYNRLKEFQLDFSDNPERTKHIEKYVKKIPFIIFLSSLVIFTILIYNKNFSGLIFAAFLLLMGFLYSEFFKKLTYKITGFKNFFVSLIWTSLVIFMALYYYLPLTLSLVLIIIFVYLREFIGVSFSDIKDIKTDKREGLLTLAIFFERKRLIDILNVINILTVIPIILGFYLNLFPKFSIMLLFTVPYTFYYLKKSRDKTVDISFLSNVIVDSEDIWWSVFILIGKTLL